VAGLQLEVKLLTAVTLGQLIAAYQRGIPLADGEDGGLGGDGEVFLIVAQDALFQL
jgi:hypothetical protein